MNDNRKEKYVQKARFLILITLFEITMRIVIVIGQIMICTVQAKNTKSSEKTLEDLGKEADKCISQGRKL